MVDWSEMIVGGYSDKTAEKIYKKVRKYLKKARKSM